MDKEFYEKIEEIYNEVDIDSSNSRAVHFVDDVDLEGNEISTYALLLEKLKKLTEDSFKKIVNDYPGLNVAIKIGHRYNIGKQIHISLSYGEKNKKGTTGHYNGISIFIPKLEKLKVDNGKYIKKEELSITLWNGFGISGLTQKEIDLKRNKFIESYKRIIGKTLEYGFIYRNEENYHGGETISLLPDGNNINTCDEFCLKVKDIDEELLEKRIRYLIEIYIKVEEELAKNTKVLEENKETNILESKNIMYKGFRKSGTTYELYSNYLENISKNNYLFIVNRDDYNYEKFLNDFSSILKKALNDKKNNYYLVMERINEFNPNILGDIKILFERDVLTNESKYVINNSIISKNVYGDDTHSIFIPSNLFLLATCTITDDYDTSLDYSFDIKWFIHDKGIYDQKYIKGFSNLKWGLFRKKINELLSSDEIVLTAYYLDEKYFSDNSTVKNFDRKMFLLKICVDLYVNISNKEKIFNKDIKSLNQLIELINTDDYLKIFNESIIQIFK